MSPEILSHHKPLKGSNHDTNCDPIRTWVPVSALATPATPAAIAPEIAAIPKLDAQKLAKVQPSMKYRLVEGFDCFVISLTRFLLSDPMRNPFSSLFAG
jgi:hypothetical protein